MKDQAAEEQADIYETRAEAYDALIAAEDCDGALTALLTERLHPAGRTWVDVGAGTGRLARTLGAASTHVHLVDRAAAMLEVARHRLTALGRTNFTIHEADVRALPLGDAAVDAAAAGWVFGHFRHWMPDGWRDDVDRAVFEMARVVRHGGPLVIIETLGTGHETPRVHAALDEYFAHLEAQHGFERTWIRTDYAFPDVERAVAVCEPFFGPELAASIRARGEARVAECTAVFTRVA